MSKEVADRMIRGLEQALAFVEGRAKKGTYVVHIPPEIDVKAIRGRLGMTQQEFAVSFGFSVNTVRHWEQGRRVIITIDPGKRSGKACIRDTRITVYDVLDYLAAGMTEGQILAGFPDLTETDIRACLAYAADAERRVEIVQM
ncbi:MAG: DUF433 domain-containing protein [Terracidiphilus sp.]